MKEEQASQGSKGAVKAILLLLSMLTIMAAGIIAPSMPVIAVLFKNIPGAPLLAKMLLTVPALFIALTASFAGRYIDQRGRLELLYVGLVLYAAAGSTGYYLNNLYQILAGRALLGIGIGIIMTITVTLIGDYYDGEERRKLVGYQSAFVGFAGVIFLGLGGVLADISWRLPFLIYLFPLLLIPAIAACLKEPVTVRHPVANPRLIPSRLTFLLLINGSILMILMFIVPTQIPFLLKAIGVKKNFIAGAAIATHAFGITLSSSFYARIKSKLSFPLIFTVAYFIMAAAYYFTGNTVILVHIFIALFFAGLGFGLLISNTNLWVMEIVPPKSRGAVIGLLTSCLFLGQFLSPVISELAVNQKGIPFLFVASSLLTIILSLAIGSTHFYLKCKKRS